jgi:hypothetical protein
MRSLISMASTVLAAAVLTFGVVLPAAAGEGCGGYSTKSVSVPTSGQSLADGSTAPVSKPGEGG